MEAGEDHESHERKKEISRGVRKGREEVRERFRLKTVRQPSSWERARKIPQLRDPEGVAPSTGRRMPSISRRAGDFTRRGFMEAGEDHEKHESHERL
jgi:hypothetical protein